MTDTAVISAVDPFAPPAVAMNDALWDEIQRRYGFTAANPADPAGFTGPVGGFWVAFVAGRPVGSIALTALGDPDAAELDVMYVAPGTAGKESRGPSLPRSKTTLAMSESPVLRLRAGEPQPEALRFYAAAGFGSIPPFGRWIGDDTARCFEKSLD